MSHLLAFLQSLAFVGLFLAMVAAPGWFIFTFIILSTIIFHASLNAAPNRNSEWGFALLQVKLGGLILHAALGIILALDYSSYSRSIAHQAALIVIGIGAIMLIGTAFIQVRRSVVPLSTRGFMLGLAATFLSFSACWLAINETFYVILYCIRVLGNQGNSQDYSFCFVDEKSFALDHRFARRMDNL